MIPYLAVLLFVVAMSALTQKKKGGGTKTLLWILILVLTCFIGFRYNVGTDYPSYYRGYYLYSRKSWGELLLIDDPALRIIAKVSSYIFDDPISMFLIVAFIFSALFITSIYKYTDEFLLAMFLFFGTATFFDSMNGVRQATAMAIIFYGFRYIKDKQFWKYLLTIFIATLFHSTAILMLVLYVLFNMKFSWRNAVILIASSLILAFSTQYLFELSEIITGKEVLFEHTYYTDSVNIFRVAVAIAPCSLIFLLSKEERAESAIYCNMLLFNAALMLATYNSTYLARMAMYSTAFVCIGITEIVKKIRFTKELKSLMVFAIVGAYFAYYFVAFMRTADLYPYETIFDYM